MKIVDGHRVDIKKGFKPQKPWAVFLDRDGVINREKHLVYKIKDFEIYPQVFPAIKLLNKYSIPVIVHHNASVVARGLCDKKQVIKLNQYMKDQLVEHDAFVDAILFCPHHPTAFNDKMKLDCFWRKPRPGMIQYPAKLFNLDLKKSYVIGDTARDILMAQAVGAKGILVETGHGGKDKVYQAKADVIVKDILTAVKFIIKDKKLL